MSTDLRDGPGDRAATSTVGSSPGPVGFVDRHLELIATAVATSPFVIAAVTMLVKYRDFAPFADIALIELGVRDVGRHVVLLGVYSRFGWRHPGPMLFYLLAIPYWLSGGSSSGLLAGAALLNGGCVVALAWLAHRRGGRQLLLLTLLFVALLSRTLGPELWTDPWNPSLALFPLLVFIFGCWSLADGDDLVIPVLVITGTFCIQSHLGYGAFVAITFVIALSSRLLLGRTRARAVTAPEPDDASPADDSSPDPASRSRHRLRWALVWGVAIGAVLWLPPLVEQVIHQPGNVRELSSFFRTAETQYGWRDGVQFTQYELGPKPVWLFGEHEAGWLGLVDYSAPPAPIGGVLLLAATALAAWRRDWSGTRLAVIALGLLAGSVMAVDRVVEGLFPYVVRWSPAVGLTAWLAVVWIGWRAVRDRLSSVARQVVGAVVAAGLVTVSTVGLWAGATTPPHDSDKTAPVRALTAQLIPHLDATKPVVVDTPDPTGGVEALFMLPAVALQLERQGFDVRVDDVRFTNRNSRGDESQRVSIHHVSPDAPTVPALAARTPTATQDDFIAWVTRG